MLTKENTEYKIVHSLKKVLNCIYTIYSLKKIKKKKI